MKRFFTLLFLAMPFMLITPLYGQVISIKGKIILKDKNGVIDPRGGEGVYVFMFNTAEDANDFTSQYKNSPTGVIRAEHVTANEKGEFTCSLLVGGHIVIYNPSTKKDPVNQTIKASDEGRTMEFTFADDGITLENVNVNAKKIQVSGPKARKARGFGRTLTWTCDNMLIADQANHDSRLVIQPYAIDCQTEDTIKLMHPFVIEGNEYHNIQNRRMGYKYFTNDSVAPYYIDSLSLSKKPLQFTATLVFEKPDPNRTYYCTAKMWLEDYTHVYWNTDGEFGSCFVSNPFKFMNFHLSGGEMPLDANEFYESPTSELRENNKSLQIQFPMGEASISDTPENTRQMSSLVSDLQSYGDRLAQVKVVGYASPDGGYDRNLKLAGDRANSVMQVIRGDIDARKVQLPPVQSIVCSWNDVADSLEARGYNSDAEQLRTIINDGKNVNQRVREMFIYDTVISQILSNQRKMFCSYMYSVNSQLKPEEALDYYRHNKDFQTGGAYRFSHGDWFNIMSLSTDSVEQKQIVDRAYKEITSTETGYEYNAFASYVANRKALDIIRAGGADTTILSPFIDYGAGANVTKPISFYNKSTYIVNRSSILANQAIMYMRLGEPMMAEFLVSKLSDDEPIKKEIGSYVDMMNWILRMDDPSLTEKERDNGREGFDYVCSLDTENNAILKAELWEDLGYDRSYVTDLVENNLSDNDARKWYLLGVLKSNDVNTAGDDDDDETEKVQPEFVGDIEKAISMNPTYARYYSSEANVSKYVFEHYPITLAQASSKKTEIADNTPKASVGNGLERYQLETRWRESDDVFRHHWYDHVWLEGGAGIENVHTEADEKYDPALTFNLGIGKQLHPFHSLRLDLQGAFAKTKETKTSYIQLGGRLDYMFSLSQYLMGYDPDRTFDVSAVLGAGLTFSKIKKLSWQKSPEFYAGLNMKFRTGPYGYIGVEPYAVLKRNGTMSFASDWRKMDVNFGVALSYVAYLNSNNTFDRPSPKPQTWRAPWFLDMSNGVTYVIDSKLGHDISLTVGKWLSPMIGIRGGYITGDQIYEVSGMNHNHRVLNAFKCDALFNPLGTAKYFSWEDEFGFFVFGGGYVGTLGRLQEDYSHQSRKIWAITAGAHLWYRLSSDLHLFVEPRYVNYHYFSGALTNPDEWSVAFGLSMYIRSNDFRNRENLDYNAELDQDETGWRVGLGGGISLLHFNRSCYDKRSGHYFNGMTYGEYHFNDLSALRLSYERFFHKQYFYNANDKTEYSEKADNTLTALDYEINLSNALSGYRTDRRLQLAMFAGGGLSFRPGLKNLSPLINGGAKLSAKVSDHIRIVMIPSVYLVYKMSYPYSVITPGKWNYFETLNVGVEYKF